MLVGRTKHVRIAPTRGGLAATPSGLTWATSNPGVVMLRYLLPGEFRYSDQVAAVGPGDVARVTLVAVGAGLADVTAGAGGLSSTFNVTVFPDTPDALNGAVG